MQKEIFRELVELRLDPKKYAYKVERSKKYFIEGGKIWRYKNNIPVITEEGPAAYDEAIDFLKNKAETISTLNASKGLSKIASDILPKYKKGVNVEIETIVKKYGEFDGKIKAFVQLDSASSPTAEQIIINLLVCDGDKTRENRDTLLSKEINFVGVAIGNENSNRKDSVIVVCTDFMNRVDDSDSIL